MSNLDIMRFVKNVRICEISYLPYIPMGFFLRREVAVVYFVFFGMYVAI